MIMHVSGSPFLLRAPQIDVSSVIVSGEGLVTATVYQQVNNIYETQDKPVKLVDGKKVNLAQV